MIDKSTRLITFIKKINKNAKQFNIEFYIEICFMKDDERGLTSIKSNRSENAVTFPVVIEVIVIVPFEFLLSAALQAVWLVKAASRTFT